MIGEMPADGAAGRLLVATPLIGDPHFSRTVVLVLAHGEAGALGLVLNRPSGTPSADLVPLWGDAACEPPVMFIGGPVAPDSVIGLSPSGTIDFDEMPDDPTDVGPVRLFAGSAGWSAGQLEGEVDDGAWWVLDARADDPFHPDPEHLWPTVLRRQPAPLAWFAVYPEDPDHN